MEGRRRPQEIQVDAGRALGDPVSILRDGRTSLEGRLPIGLKPYSNLTVKRNSERPKKTS